MSGTCLGQLCHEKRPCTSTSSIVTRSPAMADYGAVPYITAAVQVIPVLAVVVAAESFIQRDAAHRRHRIHASTAVAVGLIFGISGEVAGLQALLTGPTRQTIPVVDAGLMAL